MNMVQNDAADPEQPPPNGLGFSMNSGSPGLGFGDPMKNKVKELNCSERASCKKFQSPITSASELVHRNCFCDELCQTYDDCCRDYVRQPQSSVETLQLRPEVIACQTLSVGFKYTHGTVDSYVAPGNSEYFVVARCPANYSEPYIRSKCELGNSADADLFYRLPVNGRTSRVLYANYYCAICNGNTDVIFWTGERDACHVRGPQLAHNATIEELVATNADCDVIFVYPEGYSPRLCKKVKRQCSADWTDRKTARKCQDRLQLNSYVYDDDSKTAFRNKHCVICNHVAEAKTSCVDPTAVVSMSPPFINRMSFSILFDMNAKTQAIRNNDDRLGEITETLELQECELGSVYDPYSDICRPVFCRKGYRLTDSGCEPAYEDDADNAKRPRGKDHEKGPPSNETRLSSGLQTDLSCVEMIRLNASEYRLLSNRSAYVYAMDLLYTEDQYELDKSYLYVCSQFTRRYNTTRLVMFQFDHVQGFVSFVGVIISLMALLIQFIVYMIFSELRNTPGKCLICIVVSLFVGQLTFLFVAFEGPACFYLAAAMHFAFLAVFFWMNVLAFDIFRAFAVTNTASLSTSGTKWKRFLAYSIYAWLCPSLIVGLCITMDVLRLDEGFRPHYGEGVCWVTSQTALLIFFAVPVGVILLVNAVFFSMTIYCICRAARAAEMATPKSQTKAHLLVCIKLFFIMGLTWLFGFLASLTEWTVLWYVFIVFNTLQGAFLCLMFICTSKVYRLMRTKWSTKSTTAPQNNQKAASTNETLLSKDGDVKVVAKETCM